AALPTLVQTSRSEHVHGTQPDKSLSGGPMPERTASAAWSGGLKSGNGTVKIERAGWEGAYSFPSRFEEGNGMSPEDLIAGAHAACFSMAFAAALEKAGFQPEL